MAPEIPGFVYDEEKKKYFKIVNGGTSAATLAYHNSAVQSEKRRRCWEKNNDNEKRHKNLKRSIKNSKEEKPDLKLLKLQESATKEHVLHRERVNTLDIISRRLGFTSELSQLFIIIKSLNKITSCEGQRIEKIQQLGGKNNSTVAKTLIIKLNWTLQILQKNGNYYLESPNPINDFDNGNRQNFQTTKKSSIWYDKADKSVTIIEFDKIPHTTNPTFANIFSCFKYENSEWKSLQSKILYIAEVSNDVNITNLFGKGQDSLDYVTCCFLQNNFIILGTCLGKVAIIDIEQETATISKRSKRPISFISEINLKEKNLWIGDDNGKLILIGLNNGPTKLEIFHKGRISNLIEISESVTLVISTMKICTYMKLRSGKFIPLIEFKYFNHNVVDQISAVFKWENNFYFIVNESKYKLLIFEVATGASLPFLMTNDKINHISITEWGNFYVFMEHGQQEYNWQSVISF